MASCNARFCQTRRVGKREQQKDPAKSAATAGAIAEPVGARV